MGPVRPGSLLEALEEVLGQLTPTIMWDITVHPHYGLVDVDLATRVEQVRHPGVWAVWRTQVKIGMIPLTMAVKPVTGPGRHFTVTLARAQQIFAGAYADADGLARTVCGTRDG